MLLSSLLNYIALFFEFIGVFLIPRGFLSITSQDIESASSTFVGENVYMARSLIFQKMILKRLDNIKLKGLVPLI